MHFSRVFWGRTTGALEELEQMIFVVMLWNATWALMQVGVGNLDVDYAGMAQHIFADCSGWSVQVIIS